MKANNVSPILITIMLILAINTGCDKKKDHCDSKEILQKPVSIYVVDTTYNSIFGEVYKMQKFKRYICITSKYKQDYNIYITPYYSDFDFYDCEGVVSYKDCLFILTRTFPIEIINYKKKFVGKVFYKRYYDRTEDFSPWVADDSFSFWNFSYKDNKLVLDYYYLHYRDKRPQFSK